ncbi:MAG: class I SAM-dependent methyltransferase [Candidatus Kariarchaeaceae archaeon]|jgi:ubiquinone/menaquinone biosynthesis C-methylase UbiE
MPESNYFAGSFDKLRNHWEDEKRAIKFRKGQTRTKVAKYIVERLETDIHQGSWLDTGVGAGYIQSLVGVSVSPCFHVGLDFSHSMLISHENPYGERVRATTFNLPFRKNAFNLVTNIFSLSDYPNIENAFKELIRTVSLGGIFSHSDYAAGDQYWETRKKAHGQQVDDDTQVMGNINLRSLEEIRECIPRNSRIVFQKVVEYDVETDAMKPQFPIPKVITRRFIITEIYKPRDSN